MKKVKKILAVFVIAALIFAGCGTAQTETEPPDRNEPMESFEENSMNQQEDDEIHDDQVDLTVKPELTVITDAESYHAMEPDFLGIPILIQNHPQMDDPDQIYRAVWNLEEQTLTEPEYVGTVPNPMDGTGIDLVWTGRNIIIGNRPASDVADGYYYVHESEGFSHSGGTFVTYSDLCYFTEEGEIASIALNAQTPCHGASAPVIVAVEDGQAVVVFYSMDGQLEYTTYPVDMPDDAEVKTEQLEPYMVERYPWTGVLEDGKVYMTGSMDVKVLDIASGEVKGLGIENVLELRINNCSSWSPITLRGCYDGTLIVEFNYTVEGSEGPESRQLFNFYIAVRNGEILGMLKNHYWYGGVDESWTVCDAQGNEVTPIDVIPWGANVIFAHEG